MIRWNREGSYFKDDPKNGWADGEFGIFHISCVCNQRKYKDGMRQYMIYLSVPSADSREIITLTKIRGRLADAKTKAEWIFEDFPNENKCCWDDPKKEECL